MLANEVQLVTHMTEGQTDLGVGVHMWGRAEGHVSSTCGHLEACRNPVDNFYGATYAKKKSQQQCGSH